MEAKWFALCQGSAQIAILCDGFVTIAWTWRFLCASRVFLAVMFQTISVLVEFNGLPFGVWYLFQVGFFVRSHECVILFFFQTNSAPYKTAWAKIIFFLHVNMLASVTLVQPHTYPICRPAYANVSQRNYDFFFT